MKYNAAPAAAAPSNTPAMKVLNTLKFHFGPGTNLQVRALLAKFS
jgi:hypothetical protein